MSNETILTVKNLHVDFKTYAGDVKAIRDINFELYKGETLAIVGESGSGKSVTTRTLMGLNAKNASISGDIDFKGKKLNNLKEEEWVKVRGKEIAMIFQDPMTSLDPTMKIGKQIAEAILIHEPVSKQEALNRALKLMHQVGIPNAEEHINDYPHQWSGGMR
ncbi:Oligopeptide transport ATP-binding protein oppD [Streptococcus pseudoporcinus]|uniref:Oligopeptide transport ATP-binding protein oppD n=1 Tax=Streptococcus pseudoporcinus TaxID=361101 RepID=A0A4U9XLI3_9STRE|nr:Oligopeptide transport ATP-binding protein oppD [Streptococcus pseudoporcinus]